MKALCYQQHRHSNDSNGNPRRIFVVYSTGGIPMRVINEGYAGNPRLDLPELSPVDVTASEYRSTIRYAKDQNIWEER
jgi:hypothetical protein